MLNHIVFWSLKFSHTFCALRTPGLALDRQSGRNE